MTFLCYLNSHSGFRVKDDYDDYVLEFFVLFKHASIESSIYLTYTA
jgi:hypothetical protein